MIRILALIALLATPVSARVCRILHPTDADCRGAKTALSAHWHAENMRARYEAWASRISGEGALGRQVRREALAYRSSSWIYGSQHTCRWRLR